MPPKPKIIVIVGPTASGKTSLAVWLAHQLHGEVISADSRQVYKHLDLGTAKITEPEMEGVPHHLIDNVLPSEVYTITDWVSDTKRLITDIIARGHVPIIAGGTMQYIDALLGKQTPARVPPNVALRTELEKKSTSELFALLGKKDPVRAQSIDHNNPRRLVRALEIVDALGSVPIPERTEPKYDALILGLSHPKEELQRRIITRLHERIDAGLVEETKHVLAHHVTPERLYEIGLEYRVAMEYLDGTLTEGAMRKKLEEKVWQYAKRQLTWLKKMEGVTWVSPSDHEKVRELAQGFLHRGIY